VALPKVSFALIVEDDPEQSKFIADAVRERFPRYEVTVVEAELEFRDLLPELKQNPPAVAVIDVILAWTTPDGLRLRPDIVRAGEAPKAGLRCEELLREDPLTARIPVVLYSVTNESHCREALYPVNAARQAGGYPEVAFLSKEPEVKPLLDAIFKWLA